MRIITRNDCQLAILPKPELTIFKNGIIFSKSASLKLSLREGYNFMLNVDSDGTLYLQPCISNLFFIVTEETESGASALIPGLFDFLKLNKPRVYTIGELEKRMYKLTLKDDGLNQDDYHPEGCVGSNGLSDEGLCGINGDQFDGGIKKVIMVNKEDLQPKFYDGSIDTDVVEFKPTQNKKRSPRWSKAPL